MDDDKPNFELIFWGGTREKYIRYHSTLDRAEAEARRVLGEIRSRAAHPAIIYGPGLPKDGKTIP